jgi:hypothetical protein
MVKDSFRGRLKRVRRLKLRRLVAFSHVLFNAVFRYKVDP